ncbi:cation transporter [Lactovum odontotermitis]
MTKTTYKIEGMTCEHCAHHVTEALESVSGVKSAKVSLKKNEAEVKADDTVTTDSLETAVAAAGYKLVS